MQNETTPPPAGMASCRSCKEHVQGGYKVSKCPYCGADYPEMSLKAIMVVVMVVVAIIVFLIVWFEIRKAHHRAEEDQRITRVTNLITNYPFAADSKTLPSDYPASANYSFHTTTCASLPSDCDIGFNSFEEAFATGRNPHDCCKYDFVKHTIKKELPENIIEIQFGGFDFYHRGFGVYESNDWMYFDISYEKDNFVRKWYKINFRTGSRGGSWWGHIKWKDTDPVELDYTPPF